MGKMHDMEIDKFNDELKKLAMKASYTADDIECMHYFSECIYYLTAADSMKRADETGYMGMESSRMMPMTDYRMDRNPGVGMPAGGYGRESYNPQVGPYGGRY